jgi:uncharacterized damage-inducible protein DinB
MTEPSHPDAWSSPSFVGPMRGRAPQLEALTTMLTSTRRFTTSAVRGLDADTLAALPPYAGNSIGTLLVHLAAAERLIHNITGRGERFGDHEAAFARAFRFEEDPLRGRALEAYLDHLAEVRTGTLALLANRDDAWLATPRTFGGRPSTTHYYWHHLILDEARHTGQIVLLRKYLLPGAEPAFDPYAGI